MAGGGGRGGGVIGDTGAFKTRCGQREAGMHGKLLYIHKHLRSTVKFMLLS